jgi:hypothetical protein
MKFRSAYIILFVLLLTAAGLVWLIDPWSTTGAGLEGLLPQEPGSVKEVQVNGAYDTLLFHRPDAAWLMDGEEVNRDAVENLVYAASSLSLRGMLPAAGVKATGPVIEFIFRTGKREAGRFMFVAAASGYYVAAPGSDVYYDVELPGYTGLSLEKIFSGNPDHYRVHLLTDLLPSEIASVEVQPWRGTGFVARQDSAFNVRVWLAETGREVTAEVTEHRVRMLFSYFNAIRYDSVAGLVEDVPGYLAGKADPVWFPAEAVQENVPAGDAAGHFPAEAAQGNMAAGGDPGHFPAEPWAGVAVTTFEGVRHQFDIYQWVKPGGLRPDLFEAVVAYNGRPLLLVMNYYYLDLLVRGLEEYR